MKIIKRFLKHNKGSFSVKPVNEEDIWYLYNIIKKGDIIRIKVFRKIKLQKGDYGVKKVKRDSILLTLKILEVSFQADDKGTSLTLKTKNLSENKYVMIG